ncbi:MAG TPA: tyrosine--tRNA ligase [Clostridia bacterium]|nr:tyrosine--tRNA ligase [Clostridia bacterium]HPQ45867.1 tyrosine--tRNA ligase [Clostridia bacterium]HRX42356.1 tyrosine--tRNA ligase [Clostridia bacterium]
MNVFDVLKERGFIAQTTHEETIRDLLGKEKVTFYIGFDPTADSLHIGHFLQLIVMSHMQKAGHRPIAVLGGGTAMVGDPTGKTDMRKMITREEINHNAQCFKKQMSRFIDFSEGKAIMLDNYDWLGNLNYVDFLREIGVHFSVNRMLTAECFKSRLEKGLSFIEFNYMIMQGYDFLKLFQDFGCNLQLGGDDQWSNILGGIDLIRRVEAKESFGMTFTLLTTSDGKKMGKTEKGAIWIDEEKTSPYEFFQYWRNVDDADVERCLKLLTFLPLEEIAKLAALEDQEANKAKEVLAYEVTKLVHGEEKANEAMQAARALFSGGGDATTMPSGSISMETIAGGFDILDAMVFGDLAPSKGEARRMVIGGGVSVDGEKVTDFKLMITEGMFSEGAIVIKRGKKNFFRLELAE